MAEREERNELRNNAELDAAPARSVSSMSSAFKKRVSQEVSHIEEGVPPAKKHKMAENAVKGEVRANQIWVARDGVQDSCAARLRGEWH